MDGRFVEGRFVEGRFVEGCFVVVPLGQHWFITASIAVYIQGLYTVYNGAEVQGTVAVLELAGNQGHRQPPHMMDRTVEGLEGVFAYMDDSHVGSPDRQIHLIHLEAFFNSMATNGLAINLEKCVFAVPPLEIVGHTISVTGSAPTAGHAATIESFPLPLRTSSNGGVFSA